MKKRVMIFFVLLIMSEICYAANAPFSDLLPRQYRKIPLIIGYPLPPQYQKIPLIIEYPWYNKQLFIINSCRAYILPNAWMIQRYDLRSDECWIIYLGDAPRGQQEIVLYGQPLPDGWIIIDANGQQGIQLIKYVGN